LALKQSEQYSVVYMMICGDVSVMGFFIKLSIL